MTRLLLLLLSIPCFAQVILYTTDETSLDLSTRQERDVAVIRGCQWLRAQTNAPRELISAIERQLYHTPKPATNGVGAIANELITSQRRDAVTGGGYWLDAKGKPSISNTVEKLFLLQNL